MSNKEILEKAIQKAIDNGWDVDIEVVLPEMQKMWSLYGLRYTGYSGLLFSHEFAKALWGEKMWILTDLGHWISPDKYDGYTLGALALQAYKYHLQQMVISDDPIKYLGDNV